MRRGVPQPLAASYARKIQPHHADGRFERQECSLSPMVFRWVLYDVLSPLRVSRGSWGMCVAVGLCRLLYEAPADGMLLTARNPEEIHIMTSELQEAATKGRTVLRWKNTW